MARKEFSSVTKRQALERSEGRCEAVGKVYGLNAGARCSGALSAGVEFDHYPVRAADGGENTLDNCVAVCRTCHRYKTRMFDLPAIAKGKRISDRHKGIKKAPTGFATNRMGAFKRKIDGRIEPR
jgi:5-methylcytosine-specific restriction endonuclease McrA